jgi:hypothetical protein
MAAVQPISPVSEIPSGCKYVLITTGDKSELTRRDDNLLFTVNQTMSDNLFEAHVERVISDAELLADRERVDIRLHPFAASKVNIGRRDKLNGNH